MMTAELRSGLRGASGSLSFERPGTREISRGLLTS